MRSKGYVSRTGDGGLYDGLIGDCSAASIAAASRGLNGLYAVSYPLEPIEAGVTTHLRGLIKELLTGDSSTRVRCASYSCSISYRLEVEDEYSL